MSRSHKPKNTHGGAGRGQGAKPKEGGYTKTVIIKITEEDLAKLDALVLRTSKNKSELLRYLIRQAYEAQIILSNKR